MPLESGKLSMDAEPGQSIHTFARELSQMAMRLDCTVWGQFNDLELECPPGTPPSVIVKTWDDAQRESAR